MFEKIHRNIDSKTSSYNMTTGVLSRRNGSFEASLYSLLVLYEESTLSQRKKSKLEEGFALLLLNKLRVKIIFKHRKPIKFAKIKTPLVWGYFVKSAFDSYASILGNSWKNWFFDVYQKNHREVRRSRNIHLWGYNRLSSLKLNKFCCALSKTIAFNHRALLKNIYSLMRKLNLN